MNIVRFGGGTAFSLNDSIFHSTLHQLRHYKTNEDVGAIVEISISKSIDCYQVNRKDLLDDYRLFYRNGYVQIDNDTFNIEMFNTQKVKCEILKVCVDTGYIKFKILDETVGSPILKNNIVVNNNSVIGFSNPVSWYNSTQSLYMEAIILMLKSELSLVRCTLNDKNSPEYSKEGFRYLSQIGHAEFIIKKLDGFKPKKLEGILLNYLKLQLLVDFLITISQIYNSRYSREDMSKNLSSLGSWTKKVRNIVSYTEYDENLDIMNELLKKYNRETVASLLIENKKKSSLLEVEISYQKTYRLLKNNIDITPHNILARSSYQYTDKSNVILVKGVDTSGLSGGVVDNNGTAIGCICEGDNFSLGQRYDPYLESKIKFDTI